MTAVVFVESACRRSATHSVARPSVALARANRWVCDSGGAFVGAAQRFWRAAGAAVARVTDLKYVLPLQDAVLVAEATWALGAAVATYAGPVQARRIRSRPGCRTVSSS